MISADPLRAAGSSRLGEDREPAAYSIACPGQPGELRGAIVSGQAHSFEGDSGPGIHNPRSSARRSASCELQQYSRVPYEARAELRYDVAGGLPPAILEVATLELSHMFCRWLHVRAQPRAINIPMFGNLRPCHSF